LLCVFVVFWGDCHVCVRPSSAITTAHTRVHL
jgi:hypothetical protein